MAERIWTVPNLLTGVRILLIIPIAFTLLDESISRWYPVLLIVLAAATDGLDGLLARRYHQGSDLGKLLDPLADKVGVATVSLILTLQGKLPPWIFVALLSRDLLIGLGGIYVKKRFGILLQSNQAGKWTVTLLTLLLILLIIGSSDLQPLVTILMLVSVAMLLLSFLLYFIRFRAILLRERTTMSDQK